MSGWNLLNGLISALGVLALLAVMLHPNIHEGLITKIGLAIMAMALFLTAGISLAESGSPQAQWNASLLLRIGLAVTGIGVLVRFTFDRRARQRRRLSDLIGDRRVR